MEPDDTVPHPKLQSTDSGKLDLILWRLTELEKDLSGTVNRKEYETRHELLAGRVTSLEGARAESAKERRTILVGIIVALSVPVLRFVFELIQTVEGTFS